MIKSIRIEVGSTVLNLKIEDALVLKDELNKMFSPVATNHPSKEYPVPFPGMYSTGPNSNGPQSVGDNLTIPCVDQYSVYSTRTTADPDETWNPAG